MDAVKRALPGARVVSSSAPNLETLLKSGAREKSDMNALATKGKHEVAAPVWNYHDDDVPAPAASVRTIRHLTDHFS